MLWNFKVFIFYFCILLTTLASLTAGVVLAPFVSFKARYKVIIMWSSSFVFLSKKLLGISYTIVGESNIQEQDISIAVCNHQSMWETVFMQTLLPYQTWVVKKQLLNIPFWGWGLRLLKPISIDRERGQQLNSFISQAKKMLTAGRKVIIYPEGTRVKPGTIGRFKKGAAILAYQTGYKVTPIVLNSGDFWPKGIFPQKSGTITIIIGAPISPENKSIEEINKELYSWCVRNYPKIEYDKS